MKKYMFTAKWCGNCQVMKPIVSKIPGVEIIDVDDNQELAEEYGIMSLPTFVIDEEIGEVQFNYGILPEKIIRSFYDN